jgi:DNA-binding transcriptional ArsR family regulator
VTAVRALEVPALREAPSHVGHERRIHRVVASADDERRHIDPREVLGSIPVAQLAAEAELARPLHRDIDRRVDAREGPVDRVRPVGYGHSQHVVDVVVVEEQLVVPRVTGVAARLEALDLGEDVLVHRGHEHLVGVRVVRGAAGHHVRDHQALEVLLMVECVLHCQDPAPRLAEQDEVRPIQAERQADLLDLVDEPIELPQVRLVRLIAPSGPQLVVVDVLEPGIGQVSIEDLEVFVRRTRSAVEQQDLDVRVVSDTPRPDPELTLRRRDRDQALAVVGHRGDGAPAGAELRGRDSHLTAATYNRMVVSMQVTPLDFDRMFGALADATRRDIVRRAIDSGEGVAQLAGHYDMSFAAVQKHVAILERAGLVTKERTGRRKVVRTNLAGVLAARRLLDRYEELWRGRIDRMTALVAEEPKEDTR